MLYFCITGITIKGIVHPKMKVWSSAHSVKTNVFATIKYLFSYLLLFEDGLTSNYFLNNRS